MSTSTITFYPVDNGAMALLKLNDVDETTLLVDTRIREQTENTDDKVYDIGTALRRDLKRDANGRPYVDVLLLTHNDMDHISGFEKHFHLGPVEECEEPKEGEAQKIIVHELWSSYRFWKRASDSNTLCDDAKAFNREMKRRVGLYQEQMVVQAAGDRAVVFCKDPDGGTDGLEAIVKDLDCEFSIVNTKQLTDKIRIKVLGPLPKQDGEEDEEFEEKNRGCVILSIAVKEGTYENRLLMPGDAEVFVWEQLWTKFKNNRAHLEYDVLLTPHHTSWHSLSHDSWSESEDPQVSTDARNALANARPGAYIVSSSKPIKDDDDDPPCIGAKNEFKNMVDADRFLCTGEYPSEDDVEPVRINLTSLGAQLKSRAARVRTSSAAVAATGVALPHG